jgi:hypothetical protein
MDRDIRILWLAALAAAILTPALAAAQAPPQDKSQITPKTEQTDPKACTNERATVGQDGDLDMNKPSGRSLSNQLARTDGVICPPSNVDPAIKQPAPPGGTLTVIPPPGSPGGDPNVRPK